MQTLETRQLEASYQTDANRLVGYAAVFNKPASIYERGRRFTEIVRPGAFRQAIASGGDILCTFNHDVNRLLGRTSSGTLRLFEDSHGLRFEVDLPNSATDLKELVQRGDLRGASFTFQPRKENGEKWSGDTRELLDVYLAELGPVVLPAYTETSIGMRSLNVKKLRLKTYEMWRA